MRASFFELEDDATIFPQGSAVICLFLIVNRHIIIIPSGTIPITLLMLHWIWKVLYTDKRHRILHHLADFHSNWVLMNNLSNGFIKLFLSQNAPFFWFEKRRHHFLSRFGYDLALFAQPASFDQSFCSVFNNLKQNQVQCLSVQYGAFFSPCKDLQKHEFVCKYSHRYEN